MGCHALLQGIFPTQGWNPGLLCLLHWQALSLLLSHQGSPCIYHCGIIQNSFTALKVSAFEGLSTAVPHESEADSEYQPPHHCPPLRMGVVCPLVLGVQGFNSPCGVSQEGHSQPVESRHSHLVQSLKQRGAFNPREIRAEKTLPWEAGHLVLVLHLFCLLGNLGQVSASLGSDAGT